MKKCVKRVDKKENQNEMPPLFEGAFFIFMPWIRDHFITYSERLQV